MKTDLMVKSVEIESSKVADKSLVDTNSYSLWPDFLLFEKCPIYLLGYPKGFVCVCVCVLFPHGNLSNTIFLPSMSNKISYSQHPRSSRSLLSP